MTTTPITDQPVETRVDVDALLLIADLLAQRPALPRPGWVEINRRTHLHPGRVHLLGLLGSRAELDAWADALGIKVRDYATHDAFELGGASVQIGEHIVDVDMSWHHETKSPDPVR